MCKRLYFFELTEIVFAVHRKSFFFHVKFMLQALQHTSQGLECISQILQRMSQGLGYKLCRAGNTFSVIR